MSTSQNILLTGAATTIALMAGLFYAYSCSVNPGLNRLSDTGYVAAMQSINRAIQNPIFFISFFGAPILLILNTWVQYSQSLSFRFWFLLGATIVYLVGVLGVTILGNIPLNEGLDSFNVQTASLEEIAAQRATFEGPWNKLHTIRTLASILALILVIVACLNPREE